MAIKFQAVIHARYKVRTYHFNRYPRYASMDDHEELDDYHQERLFPFPGQEGVLDDDESDCSPLRYTRSKGFLHSSHIQAGRVHLKIQPDLQKRGVLNIGRCSADLHTTSASISTQPYGIEHSDSMLKSLYCVTALVT